MLKAGQDQWTAETPDILGTLKIYEVPGMFNVHEVLSQTCTDNAYMQITSQLLVRLTGTLRYGQAGVPFYISERASVRYRPKCVL